MRVEFHQPAGEHERYAPHSFDRLVGQPCPFRVSGGDYGQATVVAVVVDDDERGATWTVDLDDTAYQQVTAGWHGSDPGSFSIPEIPGRSE